MFRLVLCLVCIILRATANVRETENPEIHLSYDRNENYTVWKDKPLKIIIENGNTRHVWCSNKYTTRADLASTPIFVPETEFTNGDIHILNIKNVTADMSTRWVCTVLEEYHGPVTPYKYKNRNYTATNLHFNLHVKGARAVILIANNETLHFVTTNRSEEAYYTYKDGEDFSIDVLCKKGKDKHNQDTLRLEYYNAKGILLFRTKPRGQQPHIFRSVLKSNNDKYYLDCIRAARNPEREYRYRTTFFKSDLQADTVQHALILSVNGQKLTTSLSKEKSYDDYIFRYIDGEVLTITCQKMDVNMGGSLIFYAETIMSQTLRSDRPSEGVISLNLFTSDIKNKSIICGINNTNVGKPNARLLFLSDVPANGVRIRGLPRSNVLYQYTNDLGQWNIEYQYFVNDTLYLTCVLNEGFHVRPNSYASSFQWKFEDKNISSAAIGISSTPIKFSNIPFTTTLKEIHDGTKIKCSYLLNGKADPYISKTVEIILRLKPELDSEAKVDEDTSAVTSDDDNSVPMIVPIAVGVGVTIAIITIGCLVSWRKTTKRANLIENAYDSLSNQNESPIPAFPSQWENNRDNPNYAKIDEEVMQENYNYSTDNDKLHNMPYKRRSNTSENHYTEIDDYFNTKSDGLAANWNTAQPFNYNKQTETPEATASHSSNNACYNNFSDSKQSTYDTLRHNNLPINNSYVNYNTVQKPSKSKSVTFRQMSNDLRSGRNHSEGNSRQDGRNTDRKVKSNNDGRNTDRKVKSNNDGRNTDRKVKSNNDGYYANTGQDIYMQPGDMHTIPNYENNFLQNEKTDNPLDLDYAEPYDEIEISCKNDFYG